MAGAELKFASAGARSKIFSRTWGTAHRARRWIALMATAIMSPGIAAGQHMKSRWRIVVANNEEKGVPHEPAAGRGASAQTRFLARGIHAARTAAQNNIDAHTRPKGKL